MADPWSRVAEAVTYQMGVLSLTQRALEQRKVISTTKLAALLRSYAPIGPQLRTKLSMALWETPGVIDDILDGREVTRSAAAVENRLADALEGLAAVQREQSVVIRALIAELRSQRDLPLEHRRRPPTG